MVLNLPPSQGVPSMSCCTIRNNQYVLFHYTTIFVANPKQLPLAISSIIYNNLHCSFIQHLYPLHHSTNLLISCRLNACPRHYQWMQHIATCHC